jgi:paraquat-inducible protein A
MMSDRFLHDSGLRECPDCGLFQRVVRLRPGLVAECGRCGAVLRRRRRNSFSTTFALAATGVVLLFIVGMSPLLGFRLAGQEEMTSLGHLPVAFEDQDMPLLAVVVLATTVLAPFLRLALTMGVLGGLRAGLSRRSLVAMARLRALLAPWAMVEVFLLGLFIAYTRLAELSQVDIGPALYALAALMLITAWADVWLDENAMWEAIGRVRRTAPPPLAHPALRMPLIGCDSCGQVSRLRERDACPRCDTPLRRRKPHAIGRTWALMIAAAILYVPANIYPVMTVIRFGQGSPSTILGGVRELIEYRMWPLAALVFVASILVPMLKLVGLTALLVLTGRASPRWLPDRTRLYRLVDFIGRWSMIDVFMLAVLTALVRMGVVASVIPGAGAVAFASVVVLTMLAALSFDPRVMWDYGDRPDAPAAAQVQT